METSTILLIFCAIVVALALEPISDQAKEDGINQCVNDTGVDRDLLAKVWRHRKTVPDDKIKCFHFCLLKLLGWMREDGTVDVAHAREINEDDSWHRQKFIYLETCQNRNLTAPNNCDKAWVVYQCVGERIRYYKNRGK